MMNAQRTTRWGLDALSLKCIAMFAMTLDHLAWVFVDVESWLSEGLHFIGRLVAPLMVYFLVVGFYHTKDIKAYAMRLLVFALIAQLPYWLFSLSIEQILLGVAWQEYLRGNVLFTLLFTLVALVVWHSDWHPVVKATGILALYPMVQLADYGFSLVVISLVFAYFYSNKHTMLLAYVLLSPVFYVLTYGFYPTIGLGLMHFGVLLVVPLIYYFDGSKGKQVGGRYVFYWFYPVHLSVIAVLDYAV
ncbi:conjugal transfer protein TraX [Moraxella haemolytica]|uniref:TraX family protein n=1 Tax=Moraxella haemolytica TaxID=2904119 RepID=UPI002543E716|nr:TraX family protein [Moraxella sp. ZY171148]WII94857.1 conjugal transfer protein TraX [Moraxella sp. ZY171148]